ncbi:MAG: polysaccharide biosynthesis/export family protein [Pseudomonadota bacterium]|nr:polysaccharide biosynthesis/export family protein [Pseudomonadota bacterium]MEE3101308.1 polysaccharide biosynthesis/export family protein [Pseudomonadota bacterium]
MSRFAFLASALAAALLFSAPAGHAQSDPAADESSQSSAATAAELAASSSGSSYYSLRPGDTLSVTVLEDQNLNRRVLVRPDGRISMPIAGTIMAAGNSPEQVERTLRDRLSRGFQIPPTVTVSVVGLAPILGEELMAEETYAFYVVGAFGSAGRIETKEKLTILTAIAMVGGPTPFAAKDRILLRRKDENGVETVHVFNYERFEEGLPLEGDIEILPDDVIFAPERGLFD